MKLFERTASVLENKEVSPGYYRLSLACKDVAYASAPGQFVMVAPGTTHQPLLRRPFSIHDVWEGENGEWVLSILYLVVGEGTRLMTLLNPGDTIPVLGPLGKGFTMDPDVEECLLVAGGIGIAPMVFLARYLSQEYSAPSCRVLLGGRSAKDILCVDAFRKIGLDTQVITEDGSLGETGLVTALLKKALDQDIPRQIFTCGPMPMLKAVATIAKDTNTPCQASVEAAMACGMGACLGCALPREDSLSKHLHVCMDGPVLDSRLLWG